MASNHLRRRLSAAPGAVREARTLIRDFVDDVCVNAPDIRDDVALAVTEAVGNVVRHAYGRSAGLVEVAGQFNGDELRVEVRDWGTMQEHPDPGLGLGLRLMRKLGSASVIHPDDGGWLVTMRFACRTLPACERRASSAREGGAAHA